MPYGIRIKLHAHRMLHPGIGYQNPKRRYRCANTGEPGREQMETLANLVPPEEHYCKERGLHKKCEYAFDGQRGTKYITHKPRIVAPVSSKLELQYNTGGNADGKIYGK